MKQAQPPQDPQSHSTPKTPPMRSSPLNELDAMMMTTNPKWGDWDIPEELKEQLGKIQVWTDKETGKEVMSLASLWGLLGYYTRDLRLGNLSNVGGEVNYCAEHLDFAGDCLRESYPASFMTALSRTITVIELSQSKAGFLRKRQGTFTQEHLGKPLEPDKKGIFQGKRGN